MFTKKFIKIFHSVQQIGLFSLFKNLNLGNDGQSQMTFDNSGLHLVNINAYAKLYRNIPNDLRVIDIFHEQAEDKIFTNSPRTKSSQTARWQNQMSDYRTLYEIQLQVSVDFLRAVQFQLSEHVVNELSLWNGIAQNNSRKTVYNYHWKAILL